MTQDDRRPRRIIAGYAPAPLSPDADLATLWQQQRFQRVLMRPVPRRHADAHRDVQVERRRTPEPPAGFLSTMPMPTPPRTSAAPPPCAAALSPRERRPVTARAKVASRTLPAPEMPPRPDPLDHADAWRHFGLAAPAPDHWDVDLADRIAKLCRRADPSFQSWSVTVPLDPAVLPETELALSRSMTRLALRFRTHSSYSMALVSRHQKRLVALLEDALPGSRDIDVETT